MEVAQTLRCEECGREADENPVGWRAYLGGERDEETVVAIYCPACAEDEFGDRG